MHTNSIFVGSRLHSLPIDNAPRRQYLPQPDASPVALSRMRLKLTGYSAGYYPELAPAIIFTVLFGLLTQVFMMCRSTLESTV